LIVPLKAINEKDFYERINPIKASKIVLPDGDFIFPLKERYQKIRDGLSVGEVDAPIVPTLEDQDAKPADPPLEDEPKKVVETTTGRMVDLPDDGKHMDSGGVLARKYGGERGSKRPPDIPPYMWVNLSKKQKEREIERYRKSLALEEVDAEGGGGSSSSSARPASVARPKDYWKREGNKLIRYRYKERSALFTPDLTDCPVDARKLESKREIVVIPTDGSDIIRDADVWKGKKGSRVLSFKWFGKTIFTLKPEDDKTSDEPYPSMPVIQGGRNGAHREKNPVRAPFPSEEEDWMNLYAMVARPVGKKEIQNDPDAQKSLDVEWEKLMVKRAWIVEGVREWSDVCEEAREKGKKAHVGKIFEICVEKGSELPKGHKLRKFKGRTVFQGNSVKDGNSDAALFTELGSSPATMEAGKALDAYGSQEGYSSQQADGKQAYTQATPKGTKTWVRLPRERWPKEWMNKFKDPVVPLRLPSTATPAAGVLGSNAARSD
jgi:hypothetical protein